MIYLILLASAAVPPTQVQHTLATVSTVIDPYLQCRRKFDLRKKALGDQFTAAMGPNAIQEQSREVATAKIRQLLSDFTSLRSEIDRVCERTKYELIFREKMKSIQPKYNDTENSYFSAKIFGEIENVSDGIADYVAGTAKIPKAPPPPRPILRSQDKPNNAPNQ